MIRLIDQTLAVRRPDRESVSAREGEAPWRTRTRELVDPNSRLPPVIAAEDDARAITRGTHVDEGAGRDRDWREDTAAIGDRNRAVAGGHARRTGHVHECAR